MLGSIGGKEFMTLMESIRTFISTCPYLSELSKGININYLSTDIYSFTKL